METQPLAKEPEVAPHTTPVLVPQSSPPSPKPTRPFRERRPPKRFESETSLLAGGRRYFYRGKLPVQLLPPPSLISGCANLGRRQSGGRGEGGRGEKDAPSLSPHIGHRYPEWGGGGGEAMQDPDSLIHLVILYTKYPPSFRGKPLTSGHIIGYVVSIWRSNIGDLALVSHALTAFTLCLHCFLILLFTALLCSFIPHRSV